MKKLAYLLLSGFLSACGATENSSETLTAVSGAKSFSELKVNTQQEKFVLVSSTLKLPYKFASRAIAEKAVSLIKETGRASIDTLSNGSYTVWYFKGVTLTNSLLSALDCSEGLPSEAVANELRYLKIGSQNVALLGKDRAFAQNFLSQVAGDKLSCTLKGDISGLFLTGKKAPAPVVITNPPNPRHPTPIPTPLPPSERGHADVTIYADSTWIPTGSSTNLRWNMLNASNCILTANGYRVDRYNNHYNDVRDVYGNYEFNTGALSEDTTFIINCETPSEETVTNSVHVRVGRTADTYSCPSGMVFNSLGNCVYVSYPGDWGPTPTNPLPPTTPSPALPPAGSGSCPDGMVGNAYGNCVYSSYPGSWGPSPTNPFPR